MRRSLDVTLAIALLAFAIPAQASPAQSEENASKSLLASYVVDREGRAVANARVYLVGLLGQNRYPVELYESQQVVTDAKGRFEARVRRRRKYLAWSARELDANNIVVSAAVELSVGSEVVLHEGATQRPRRLELEGRKSWRSLGAVRYELWVRHGNAVAPLPWRRRRRGKALLVPPAPHVLTQKLLLLGYGEEGEEILRDSLRFRDSSVRLELLPPRKLTIRVSGARDAYQVLRGRPDGLAWAGSRTIRRVIGRSEAGKSVEYQVARWRTPRGVEPREIKISAMSASGAEVSKDVELEDHETWDPVELDLGPGFVTRGRVLVRDRVPAARMDLLAFAKYEMGGWEQWADPQLLKTQADGSFEWPGRSEQQQLWLVALPNPAQRRSWAKAGETGLPSLIPLIAPGNADPRGLGEIRLDELERVPIKQRSANGVTLRPSAYELRFSEEVVKGVVQDEIVTGSPGTPMVTYSWGQAPLYFSGIAAQSPTFVLPKGSYSLKSSLGIGATDIDFAVPWSGKAGGIVEWKSLWGFRGRVLGKDKAARPRLFLEVLPWPTGVWPLPVPTENGVFVQPRLDGYFEIYSTRLGKTTQCRAMNGKLERLARQRVRAKSPDAGVFRVLVESEPPPWLAAAARK